MLEYKEGLLGLLWVKVKFVRELWVFVNAYWSADEQDEQERKTFWNYVYE